MSNYDDWDDDYDIPFDGMDEEDFLYRAMDEEDPMYMGPEGNDAEDDDDDDDHFVEDTLPFLVASGLLRDYDEKEKSRRKQAAPKRKPKATQSKPNAVTQPKPAVKPVARQDSKPQSAAPAAPKQPFMTLWGPAVIVIAVTLILLFILLLILL